MKVKPKEIMINVPCAHLFNSIDDISLFCVNINTIIVGKQKIKYEELGQLSGKYVGLFYLQRNNEFTELYNQFKTMIDQEEVANYNSKKNNGGIECDTEQGPCACGAWHYNVTE